MSVLRVTVVAALTSAALPGLSLTAPPARATAATPMCHGHVATIVGSRGTPGPDVIVSGPMNGLIHAGRGDDIICAGRGEDVVYAGPGDDVVYGGPGPDTLVGGSNADRMRGGEGNNVFRGGPGDDLLVGGHRAHRDPSGWFHWARHDEAHYLTAPAGIRVDLRDGTAVGKGSGHDTLRNIHVVSGTRYDDVIYGDREGNLIYGSIGDDLLVGRGGDDLLDGGHPTPTKNPSGTTDDDRLLGGRGSDDLRGDRSVSQLASLDDVLRGGPGPDALQAGPGHNRVIGGPGRDTFEGTGEGLVADLAAGTAVATYEFDRDGQVDVVTQLREVENLRGSGNSDVLRGDDDANLIEGSWGNDEMVGRGGDDILVGFRYDWEDPDAAELASNSADGGTGRDACAAGVQTNCEVRYHYPT
jgi:Ca2+-binding RTX toxin-like protein